MSSAFRMDSASGSCRLASFRRNVCQDNVESLCKFISFSGVNAPISLHTEDGSNDIVASRLHDRSAVCCICWQGVTVWKLKCALRRWETEKCERHHLTKGILSSSIAILLKQLSRSCENSIKLALHTRFVSRKLQACIALNYFHVECANKIYRQTINSCPQSGRQRWSISSKVMNFWWCKLH